MSTAIGIAIKASEEGALTEAMIALADQHGYGVESDLNKAEDDMKTGLAEVMEAFGLNKVMLLKAPKSSKVALAFDIEEDLRLWESEKKRPVFFDFLLAASSLLKEYGSCFYVFFSGEWYEGDRIRLEKGHIEDLITFLQRPANWNERLFVPKTGCYQESDEVPLVYKVRA